MIWARKGSAAAALGRAAPGLLALLLVAGCSTETKTVIPSLPRVYSDLAADSLWYRQPQYTPAPAYTQPQPLLYEGRTYFADRPDHILALDALNGRMIWQTELKPPAESLEKGVQLSTGLGAGAGLLLVGTRQGRLLALDIATGNPRWEAQLSSEVSAPAAVANAMVIARSNDGRVYSFNAADGRQLWMYSSEVPPLSLRGSSRLVFDRDRVYVGLASGRLVALSLTTGDVAWDLTIGVAEGRSEFERLVDVNADPAVVGDTVYAAAYQARVVAVTTATGRIQWSRDVSTYQGLLVDGDRLYLSTDKGSVLAINRDNGTILWRQDELAGRRITAPVLSLGRIMVADELGYAHWLSPDDGSFTARRQITAGAIDSAPIVDRNLLYVADATGALQVFKISEKQTRWQP
jgi:outer membrane protein assembly factor BamB